MTSFEGTTSPYYASYNSAEITARILEHMLGRYTGPSRAALASPMKITGLRHLAYCPSCRSEDLIDYGETYWRRSHQIPGVLLCDRHQCLLTKSSASVCFGDVQFHLAGGTTDRALALPSTFQNQQPSLLTAIAQRSRQFLHEMENDWSGDDRSTRYRRRLVQLGLEGRPGTVSYRNTASAIEKYFGSPIF